jgi:hypothetical protein
MLKIQIQAIFKSFIIFTCVLQFISQENKCMVSGCDCYLEGNITLTLCSPGLLKCFNNKGENQCKYNESEKKCGWDLTNNELAKCLNENKFCVKIGCALENCVPFNQVQSDTCTPPYPAKRACYEYASCKLEDGKCSWGISTAIDSCLKSYS